MPGEKIQVQMGQQDAGTAYIRLPRPQGDESHPVVRTIGLHEIIENYEGPLVYLDFDEAQRLVGIEILA
jgi:hypothetical protein